MHDAGRVAQAACPPPPHTPTPHTPSSTRHVILSTHSFLPDKAIDLIDEAGSRVRLKHIQLPEEARDLDKELKQVTKDKDTAVRTQVSAHTLSLSPQGLCAYMAMCLRTVYTL